MSGNISVIAIIAAYNEADIIEQVICDLIDQGIGVYFLDDASTDGTLEIVERYCGRGVVGVERLSPATGGATAFEWERTLTRKAQLASELEADWFIHHDADEFRESPWPHMSLRDAIQWVDALGFNAIDFSCLEFQPDHDHFKPGDDVRKALQYYAAPASYDRIQVRCWKKTGQAVSLAASGGHDVGLPSRRVFPLRFLLRHYPIRGQAHGERKVFRERRARFLATERARGWHVQYDGVSEGASFIRDQSQLTHYDPDNVRLSLALRHRDLEEAEGRLNVCSTELHSAREEIVQRTADMERLQEALDRATAELATARAESARQAVEAATLRADIDARGAELGARRVEVDRMNQVLRDLTGEIGDLRSRLEDRIAQLDDIHRSRSWRWTSPLCTALAPLLAWRGRR